jgi:hypothetical protein
MQMGQSGSPNRFYGKRPASKGSHDDEDSESEYDEEVSGDYGDELESENEPK